MLAAKSPAKRIPGTDTVHASRVFLRSVTFAASLESFSTRKSRSDFAALVALEVSRNGRHRPPHCTRTNFAHTKLKHIFETSISSQEGANEFHARQTIQCRITLRPSLNFSRKRQKKKTDGFRNVVETQKYNQSSMRVCCYVCASSSSHLRSSSEIMEKGPLYIPIHTYM